MPKYKKRKIEQLEDQATSDFDNLLERLNSSSKAQAPSALQKLIAREDLQKILGYFLNSQDRVLTRKHAKHINNIIALAPNESYRIDKAQSLLARTLTVLRTKLGEYKLIAETKSKLQDNSKQELEEAEGKSKKGKPAWCLDDYEEYFNLVAKLDNDDELDNIKEEVKLSQQLTSPQICEYWLGPDFEKNGQRKVSVYAKKAHSNLAQFLSKNNLTHRQNNEIIKQLILAVKHLHDNDIIHQDLKPENILVFGNLQEGIILKLADFGVSAAAEINIESLASAEYMSPEIASYYSRADSLQHEYFQSEEAQQAYGNQPLKRPASRQWGEPDKANDMWALGVVIFEIRYGRLPKFPLDKQKIEKDPLMNGLLQANRYMRFTIEDALNHVPTPRYPNRAKRKTSRFNA